MSVLKAKIELNNVAKGLGGAAGPSMGPWQGPGRGYGGKTSKKSLYFHFWRGKNDQITHVWKIQSQNSIQD